MGPKTVIFILIIIGLIAAVSGCTSHASNVNATEKVLMDSNVSAGDIQNISLAVPEGYSTLKVEYSNLTNNGGHEGILVCYMFDVTPQKCQPVSNYFDNLVDEKAAFVESTFHVDGSLELNAKNAKALIIFLNYVKGHIRVTAI